MVSPSRTAGIHTHRLPPAARALAPALSQRERGQEFGALGQAVDRERAGGGQEVVVRRFGANARLDRVAVDAQVLLPERQRLATGHPQLPLHQVQAGDRFGDGVFDLQACVHLHEEETHAAFGRLFDDELHRARAHVVHRLGRRHGGRAHLRAQLGRHARSGRFFQHLLVAALHRAVALEQVDAVALGVAEHLDLDVARALHVFFDQHGVAAEAVARLALATRERGGEVPGFLDHAHALAATTGTGLDERGVADAVGLALQQGRFLVAAVVTRHQRHAGLLHQLFGLGLEAHRENGRGRRANEGDAGVGAGVGEGVVLAQEAVARVDGLRARGLGGLDDAFPAQVAVLGRTAADVHRLVAGRHVFGAGIGVGVHGHGANAQAARGGGDPAGNLAPVGDQDFLEHVVSSPKDGRRYVKGMPNT